SMAKMKVVAPKMKALQEQYANDKQQLQMKMMELYKTEKINPLGGCLPILVQIPVFIPIYWVLLGAVELRHAPWLGWIHDPSAHARSSSRGGETPLEHSARIPGARRAGAG